MAEVLNEIAKWVGIIATAVGLPGVVLWFLNDRRTGGALKRKAEAEASREEGVVVSDVRKSSVVSLEAEIAALSSSFETDRKIKQATIEWLTSQLTAERQNSALKDQRIRELEQKVNAMTSTIDTFREELTRVRDELTSLRDPRTA